MTATSKSLFSPLKPVVQVQKVLVTPELAQGWLTYNTMNRPLSDKLVAKYAETMRSGNWKSNGDTVSFAIDDTLLDGQHRLAAIVKSGVALEMIVVSNLEKDVFSTKDTGRKRSGADILGILGEQNASTVAAVLVKLVHYYAGCAHLNNSLAVDYPEALRAYPEVRDICKHYQLRSLCRFSSSILAAYVVCSRVNKAQADEFFARVADGIGLTADSPERLLREQLLRMHDGGTKGRTAAMAWVIKAWNAKRTGRKIKLIQWRRGQEQKEDFPIAI